MKLAKGPSRTLTWSPISKLAFFFILAAGNSSWKARHATRQEAAEVILQSSRVDALIADGPLPGVPPEALFKSASSRCPTAFRLALSGNYESGPALRTMGYAHQNLWKPCTTMDVRTVLAQAFALRDLLHNDRLRLLIAQIDNLPSLPRLYLDFLDEIRKPHPSHDRLSDIISHDLGLCSKILQLVNSAFFGLPRKIDHAGEALLHLGLENVRALVLSIQVFSLFEQNKVKSFSADALWDHSFQVGVLARNIASLEMGNAQARNLLAFSRYTPSLSTATRVSSKALWSSSVAKTNAPSRA